MCAMNLDDGPNTAAVSEVEASAPPSASATFVSVVVCTHNRADLLDDCLQSLAHQTLPDDRYEIIVVENGCTDHTSFVVERFARESSNFRVIQIPEPGKSRAANAGVNAARGTHVAFIDDDSRAPRSWVEQIASAFAVSSPTPAVVLGTIEPAYERAPPAWWEPATAQRTREKGFLATGWDRHRVCGSNMAFNKKALVDSGGFSEDRGPVGSRYRSGEDTEAVFRVAERHPFLWYDRSIVVRHRVPAEHLTIRHLVWRAHLTGIALAEIDRIRLFSFRIPSLVLRFARSSVTKAPEPGRSTRFTVLLARLVIRLSTIAGMVRGARLLR